MTRLSKKNRSDIISLAVAYSEFLREVQGWKEGGDNTARDNSVIVWGEILLEKQASLGVEVFENLLVEEIVAGAKRRLGDRKEVAA